MSSKTRTVLSYILLIIPSLLMAMSVLSKLSGDPAVVEGLSQVGFGPFVTGLGLVIAAFLVLLFIPKTQKIGFYLLLSYLGGAAAIEVSGGGFPLALVLIALYWAGMFVKNSEMFLPRDSEEVPARS